MIQLGISAFYHDAAACIVKDGKVLAAAEEERFTEIKHDESFPYNAIEWALDYCNLTIEDIDQVCWYERPDLKKDRVLKTFKKHWWKTFKLKKQYLKDSKKNDPDRIVKELGYKGEIIYIPHHLSHAAFSYLTSPYNEAAILTVDGVGEWETLAISLGKGNEIYKMYSVDFPHSLGLLYSTITAFLGFKPNEGEYKVMGLAPYGDPKRYYNQLRKVILPGDDLRIDTKYFPWEYSDTIMYNKHFANLLKLLPRLPEEEVTQDHKDLAAALQLVYEEEFLKLVKKAKELTGLNNLVLGGGCAYNGVANAKAYNHFKSVYIPFAPSDAGSAIGACLYNYPGERKDNSSPYLGPDYSEDEIKGAIDKLGVKFFHFKTDEELAKRVASLISKNNIVAWFQGRMEFGARALGNRSILANPRNAGMRQKLNMVIKKREGFRPFAPSVLKEQQKTWFLVKEDIPFMNQVVKTKGFNYADPPNYLPSATHIDYTARVHTVTEKQNKKYYLLLQELYKQTGFGVTLNTSFNLKDQTITMTPNQAIERFISSEIDYLVINNYLIFK
jgi:carbamoyltransferase